MKKMPALSEEYARQLRGKQVAKVIVDKLDRLVVEFEGGESSSVTWRPEGLATRISGWREIDREAAALRPTQRQLEYLGFIRKNHTRYGRAPAESDIEKHFLVSAPSVNQRMQTLEKRGFITRQPGVPRSARICIELGEFD